MPAADWLARLLTGDNFAEIRRFAFRARNSRVLLTHASQNLGYAGAINAWLTRILPIGGWDGVSILNPDTEPEPDALRNLVERARVGRKGMVGSTIVPFHDRHRIACRAGLQWHRLTTQPRVIGFSDPLHVPARLEHLEASMDSRVRRVDVCHAGLYQTDRAYG